MESVTKRTRKWPNCRTNQKDSRGKETYSKYTSRRLLAFQNCHIRLWIKTVEYCQVKENDLPDDNFESRVEEFTEYYCTDSLQDIREKLVRMYFIKYLRHVIGYVTLTMAHIRHDATDPIKAKQVNGNIPALLISHLAVHKDFQRQGVGTAIGLGFSYCAQTRITGRMQIRDVKS